MKAKKWIMRARGREDAIDRFSDLWLAFNNQYAGYAGDERTKIKRFADDRLTDADAGRILKQCGDEVAYLTKWPVVDMRRNGRDTRGNIHAYHDAEPNAEKLKQILLIAYQVRCNLMHGQKSPDRNRDNRLCECAAPVILAVLESAM